MNRFLKVKDHSDLVRDVSSNAIIANDDNAFADYKRRNAIAMKHTKDIAELKAEMSEIKTLLVQILNKGI